MLSPLDEMLARDRQRERERLIRQREPLHRQVTMTRVYAQTRDYRTDIQRLRTRGWRVQRAWRRQPRVSLDHVRAGTPAALIRVPCGELMVIYARPAATSGQMRPAAAPRRQWDAGRRTLGRMLIQAGAFIAGICAATELGTASSYREPE